MLDVLSSRISWVPEYKNQKAPGLRDASADTMRVIDRNTGNPVAAQLNLRTIATEEKYRLRSHLEKLRDWDDKKQVKVSNGSARLSGIRYESRVFGVTPPAAMRLRYGCSYSTFNKQHPEIYAILTRIIQRAENLLAEYMPLAYEKHQALVETNVHPDWRIGSSHFTSGIINNTAALPYHKDSGNIKGTLNVMLCLRSGVGGGSLHLPEWDVNFAIPDWSITTFDGQMFWHGVTPFTRTKKESHRYTIVFYAKQAVTECVSFQDEHARAAYRATNSSTTISQPKK